MDTNAKFLDIISRAGNSDISDEDFFELGKIFSKMDLDRKYKADTKLVHPDLHPDDTQASKEVMQTAMTQLNARRDRLYSKYRIQEHPNDRFEVVTGSSYSSYSSSDSYSSSGSSYGESSSSSQQYDGGYQDAYSGGAGYDSGSGQQDYGRYYDGYYGKEATKKPSIFRLIGGLVVRLFVIVIAPGFVAFLVSKGLGDYLHGGLGAMTDTALTDGTTAGFGKIGYPFWTSQEMLKWTFLITIGILLVSAFFSGRDTIDSDSFLKLLGGGARTFIAVHIFVFIANVVQAELPAFLKLDVVEIGGMLLLALLALKILPVKTLTDND